MNNQAATVEDFLRLYDEQRGDKNFACACAFAPSDVTEDVVRSHYIKRTQKGIIDYAKGQVSAEAALKDATQRADRVAWWATQAYEMKLIVAGGNLWRGPAGERRIYFNMPRRAYYYDAKSKTWAASGKVSQAAVTRVVNEIAKKIDPSARPSSARVFSDAAVDACAKAKFLGGKALLGAVQQREQAEKIRAEKIGQMTDDQARQAVDPKGLLTHSEFWIKNRARHGREIGEFVALQKSMLKRFTAARDAGDTAAAAKFADEYNALTTMWGF